jgi:Flp pilus assembly protein TadD
MPTESPPCAALRWPVRALLLLALCATVRTQHPAPAAETRAVPELLHDGADALEHEDPVAAWHLFLTVQERTPGLVEARLGLGRTQLLLGRPLTAAAYARAVLGDVASRQEAMALLVRTLIRARRFEDAVQRAATFAGAVTAPTAELLASQASALFRVQRTDEAAAVYRAVLRLEPENAEAHLRLGSGLSSPREVAPDRDVDAAVASLRHSELEAGIRALGRVLERDPDNPVVHRLLGEALFQRRLNASMASQDPAFHRLAALLDDGVVVDRGMASDFVPGYRVLDGARKAVVERALSLFASRLPKLLALGARHDLMIETERTTDAESRAALRGRRTFDGRVWDDVRGIGGLQAATGIEALDEAAQAGFDTLAHELAHQVHYYAFGPRERARIRALYTAARAHGRCLDYYAASNEAEYFAQGVEAFSSFGKRPGCETTHGHTRFELRRTDPELYDLVAELVDRDPLRDERRRQPLLVAAIEVALRCGRAEDALTAAEQLASGPLRERWTAVATIALRDGSSH